MSLLVLLLSLVLEYERYYHRRKEECLSVQRDGIMREGRIYFMSDDISSDTTNSLHESPRLGNHFYLGKKEADLRLKYQIFFHQLSRTLKMRHIRCS